MAKSDYLMSLPEASKIIGWGEESMRQAIRNDKLSFATGYQQDSGKWVFVVDRNAFEKCLAGKKDLFK